MHDKKNKCTGCGGGGGGGALIKIDSFTKGIGIIIYVAVNKETKSYKMAWLYRISE